MVSIYLTCLLAWCNIYLPTYTIVYYYTCLRSFNKTAAPRRCVAQWFQIAQNSPKISSPNVISLVFPCKLLQIHITSVSGCLDFTFKICQIVAGTSMIRQFHDFFLISFLAGFCNVAQHPAPYALF